MLMTNGCFWNWMRSLACCLAAISARPGLAQDTQRAVDSVEVAQRYATFLVAENFEEAVKLHNEKMKSALPVDNLNKVWRSAVRPAGQFLSFGAPTVQPAGSKQLVMIPAHYELKAFDFSVVVEKSGLIAGFYFKQQEVVVAYETPAYVEPSRFKEEVVTFGLKGWELHGRLTLPKGDARVPGVVLVHGSGPNDEDETIGQCKPFKDLAGGLSSRGVAVLRYPKRTLAHKEMFIFPEKITVRDEVIVDALEAVRFLRTRPEIDASRIYLLGHSLGGTLAPQIAGEDKGLGGIVLMAATPRDLLEVALEQMTYIAALPGPGQHANEKELKKVRDSIAKLKSGVSPADVKVFGTPATYWNEVSDHGRKSLKQLPELSCRVLVIGGGRDYQVTRKDFDLYQEALKDHEDAVLKWYEEMNHLFIRGQGKATPAEYDRPGHVDEQVIEDLAGWLKK
ncbi:MAG: alpha/beta fold hydrolase [Planctomycetota bacterium]